MDKIGNTFSLSCFPKILKHVPPSILFRITRSPRQDHGITVSPSSDFALLTYESCLEDTLQSTHSSHVVLCTLSFESDPLRIVRQVHSKPARTASHEASQRAISKRAWQESPNEIVKWARAVSLHHKSFSSERSWSENWTIMANTEGDGRDAFFPIFAFFFLFTWLFLPLMRPRIALQEIFGVDAITGTIFLVTVAYLLFISDDDARRARERRARHDPHEWRPEIYSEKSDLPRDRHAVAVYTVKRTKQEAKCACLFRPMAQTEHPQNSEFRLWKDWDGSKCKMFCIIKWLINDSENKL